MQDFHDILDELEQAAAESDAVSVADVREKIGTGAFGAALLALGLVLLSPIGGIPGAPTLFSLLFVLIAGQLLVGRRGFWLPSFLLKRSVGSGKMRKAVRFARPGARFLGKVLRTRLDYLTRGPFAQAIGGIVALLALSLPPLEIVPFGATAPAAAITAFGLALVARDGALAALALAVSGGTVYLLVTLI